MYLKTPNAPGQRVFLRCTASFFLEIRQYSREKMSCSTQKSLAAGQIMSFQIHTKKKSIVIFPPHGRMKFAYNFFQGRTITMDCQDYITELVERKKGQHLQREERGAIQHLKNAGYSNRAIARAKAYSCYVSGGGSNQLRCRI